MDEPRPEPHVYLVDGTSQLFRAYFAIRGLTGPDGKPTNAVFGFTAMLRKLLQEELPPYLGVAFDLAGPTFRHDRYADYKAHRPDVPDDLVAQMPLAREVCRALRIPVLELPGYEADDLIATYSRLARERGFTVTVVASDKDLLQLVGDGVSVLNPSKNVRLDATGVAESFGVPPARVADVLGLMGDAVDNIPGVPGVGEKTALAMVSTYGGLERVVERAGAVVAFFDARDRTVETADRLLREPESLEAAAELAATCAEARRLLAALRAVEVDAPFRARLAALDELLARGVAREEDEGPKEGAKRVREIRKALVEIERGSSRKAWLAVHAHRADAELSRELATLDPRAPAEFDPAELRVKSPDLAAARELFRSLGFRTLLAEVSGDAGAALPEAPPIRREIVATRSQMESLVAAARAAGRIAVAVEADGADPLRAAILGIAIACGDGGASYLPLGRPSLDAPEPAAPESLRACLAPLLADGEVAKVGHDVKRTLHLLRRCGIPADRWALDTRVAAFLLDPGRAAYRIERLAEELLGARAASALEGAGDARSGSGLRAAEETRLTLLVAAAIEPRLDEEGLGTLYREVDGPLLPILARMEERGIKVDAEVLRGMSREMEESLGEARARIRELAGTPLNPDSPKQLREVLFGSLGLKPGRKTAKSRVESTDAETLEQLAEEHEIAREVLRYRELAKLKGTYVDTLPALIHPDTGRVHTNYDPAGAATGRLSSSDPNLQNIPVRTELGRRIRSAFVPEPGFVFVASDYSQVELRVLAHLCGDPELIAAFRAGEDIHRRTASRIFGVVPDLVTDEMRRRAKAVNFGILYGMSESRLAREQGIPRADARRFIEAYFERFRAVREYIERIRSDALRDGAVRTLFGRLRRFPQLRGRAGRAEAEQALRGAVNTTIQGTAADLMKMAMIRVEGALVAEGLRGRLLLQVHDELLLEVPEAEVSRTEELVRREMEGVYPLEVPLAVDRKVGRSWSEVA